MRYSFAFFTMAFAVLIFGMFAACRKDKDIPVPANELPVAEGAIPEDFNFPTSRVINLTLTAKDVRNAALRANKLIIFSNKPTATQKDTIATGSISSDGTFTKPITVPAHISRLYVLTNYPGLLDTVSFTIPQTGSSITQSLMPDKNYLASGRLTGGNNNSTTGFNFPGTWDANGVPIYRSTPDAYVSPPELNPIYWTIPEGRSLAAAASDIIPTNADVLISPDAPVRTPVSVTFVHESSAKRNTLAYYTYDRASPPTNVFLVRKLLKSIIFPNTSFAGSRGGLVTGNTVTIGSFAPNTGIGFVLLPDAFSASTSKIDTSVIPYYSNSIFNTEPSYELKKHAVLLNMPENPSKMILGFEDSPRQLNTTDHDFNDAVFMVSTNAANAFDEASGLPALTLTDTDRDGVDDFADCFPKDYSMAYSNYYPASGKTGLFCFEDLWPATGDFDFNDLIVAYNYNVITNAGNKVTQINFSFRTVAAGGQYRTGFGLSLGVPTSAVLKMKDKLPLKNLQYPDRFSIDPTTGTEKNQNLATFIVFDTP
ncbi:MAG: LruC domain-containing protein, partial [Bacteroidota bacterium]